MHTVQEVLEHVFQLRKIKNSSYSLRAFSRDIGLSPSRLSEVLSSGKNLSPAKAEEIAPKIFDCADDARYLKDLASFASTMNAQERERINFRLQTYRQSKTMNILGLDEFEFISAWYHLAILELLNTSHPQKTESWISKKLGLGEPTVHRVLQRLTRLGLINSQNGELTVIKDRNFVPAVLKDEKVSKAMLEFHRSIIIHGLSSVEYLPRSERLLSTALVRVPKSAVARFLEKVQDLQNDLISQTISEQRDNRKFKESSKSSGNEEEIIAFTVQAHKVTKK